MAEGRSQLWIETNLHQPWLGLCCALPSTPGGLEREHGIGNAAEIKRRAQRLAAENALLKKKKRVVPMLAQRVQRLTQRSLKFIRCLRYHLFAPTCYEQALALLRAEFAEL